MEECPASQTFRSTAYYWFVCTFLLAFLSFHNVEKVFSVTGYSLSMADMVHITSLVLGISALIVAEVFAIGLKMKEEQELTI